MMATERRMVVVGVGFDCWDVLGSLWFDDLWHLRRRSAEDRLRDVKQG